MCRDLSELGKELGGKDAVLHDRNGDGGLTYRVGERFLKVSDGIDLRVEAERTRWVGRYLPVAEVVSAGERGGLSWMWTSRIVGGDLTLSARARLIGSSLRRFHEILPVSQCPWRAPDHARMDDDESDLVVCHNDPCVPNMIGGTWIDLGEVGVGDRWWDVSVACMSVDWPINGGPGYSQIVADAYVRTPGYRELSFNSVRYAAYVDFYRDTIGFPEVENFPAGEDTSAGHAR